MRIAISSDLQEVTIPIIFVFTYHSMACINVDGGPTEIEMMTPAAFAAATASAADDGPNGNSSRFEYVNLIVLMLFYLLQIHDCGSY